MEHRRDQAWAYAAAAWAVAFALLSIYWGLGGTFAADTLAHGLEDHIRSGEDSLAFGFIPAALKMGLAGLAVLLATDRSVLVSRRTLVRVGWVVGGSITVYGAISTIEKLLMRTGVIGTPDALEGRVGWYLFLWDPFWLLGGVLFLLAASAARH